MDVLRVTPSLSIPLDEIEVRTDTSGGAGGQHANRSSTRVEVTFDIAESPTLGPRQRARLVDKVGPVARSRASDTRSQSRNRDLAMQRLAAKLADALRVDAPRRPTRATRASVTRRLDAKHRRSSHKLMRRPPSATDE